LVMEEFCKKIKEKYPNNNDVEVLCYVDDSTLIVDPKIAREVINFAIQAAEETGFFVNKAKSSVICKNGIPPPTEGQEDFEMITINTLQEEFKMLGMLLNDTEEAYESYNNSIKNRVNKFFDRLDAIDIHVELKHQILMMCGAPRLLYYCETTPPNFAKSVVECFHNRIITCFAKMIDISNLSSLRDEMLFNTHGASLPNYLKHYEQIYLDSVSNISSGNYRGKLSVKLVDSGLEPFTSPECLIDRHWSAYRSPSRLEQMQSSQYKTALAIRCRLIPDHIRNDFSQPVIRCKCDNEVILSTDNKIVALQQQQQDASSNVQHLLSHVMSCHAVNKFFYTQRHELVKNSVIRIARAYGIHCTPEPNFYTYPSGQHNRPDCVFHLPARAKLVTDFTVVHTAFDGDVNKLGLQAETAATEKNNKHKQAVSAMGHQFIPFAIESNGHLGQGAIAVINELTKYVAFESKFDFKRDIKNAVSTALAMYRVEVLIGTLTESKIIMG